MDPSRISALLEPFLDRPLPGASLRQISTYIDLLLRWTARINLTAVRSAESIVTRHFGESLFLARHVFPAPANLLPACVLDIGSGAGFPALPLKIWAPAIRLTLVESNHKKAAFLREVARTITLTDVNVLTERAEALTPHGGSDLDRADLVTFRAVEHFESILPLAARFLAPAGRLAILIGASQLPALSSVGSRLSWLPPIPIPKSKSRLLVISNHST